MGVVSVLAILYLQIRIIIEGCRRWNEEAGPKAAIIWTVVMVIINYGWIPLTIAFGD